MPKKNAPRANKKNKTAKKYRKGYRRGRKTIGNPIAGLFPRTKNFTMLYKEPSAVMTSTGLTNFRVTQFRLNSLWDFDFTGDLYNKQPLYYDMLFTATGPYKSYRVNAWKTTIKVINLSDKVLNVYYDQSLFNNSEGDTELEMKNRPGVIYKMLTGQNNSTPTATFTTYKKLTDFVPKGASWGTNFTGTWTTDPTSVVWGSLLAATLDGSTTSFNFACQITHTFYVTAFDRDCIVNT